MKTVIGLGRLLLVVGVLGLFPAEPIHAGCSDPSGNERDMRYNDEYHTYEFCDGTQWVSMGKPIPGRGGGGFFVITKTVYDGNFGSTRDDLSAPDKKCLTELTTETGWKGYSVANTKGRLIAAKVHAFLCTERNCNALVPFTTYYFGNAADRTAGGASFTTDAQGDGPNDSADWRAANYFGGDYFYWTGYRAPRTDSSWNDVPTSGGYQCKTTNSWDTGTNNASGVYGRSASGNRGRWWAGNDPCDHTHPLICYVDP